MGLLVLIVSTGPTGSNEAAICSRLILVIFFSLFTDHLMNIKSKRLPLVEEPRVTGSSVVPRAQLVLAGVMDPQAVGPSIHPSIWLHLGPTETQPNPITSVCRKLAKKRKETLSSRQEMTLMVNSSQHTAMVDTHTLNGRSESMHTHTHSHSHTLSNRHKSDEKTKRWTDGDMRKIWSVQHHVGGVT